MADRRLIVGLGNPGKDYAYTRHNLGFLVLDKIIEQQGLKVKKDPAVNAYVATAVIEDVPCSLLMPQTFMNNSGPAVKAFVARHQISVTDILVVCDDFSLDFGQLRLRLKGSDGGHNGLGSIVAHLGSRDFARLRLGIGHPGQRSTVDYVLEKFTAAEKKQLGDFTGEAAQCTVAWVTQDIDKVMSQFNKRKGNG